VIFLKEEKRERFIKVAENRTNKILKTIKLLGNCANKNNYDYTEDEIKTIFNAIEQEVKKAKLKFDNSSEKEVFKLK
jgi:hypothetical protein